MNTYRAEYSDENFEIIVADNDSEALNQAWEYENEHGTLFNLVEVDSDYEEIRTVMLRTSNNVKENRTKWK
jgi:hypothetical protein